MSPEQIGLIVLGCALVLALLRVKNLDDRLDGACEAGMDLTTTLEEYREDLSRARSELSSAESLRDDYKSRLENVLTKLSPGKKPGSQRVTNPVPPHTAKPKARSALTP